MSKLKIAVLILIPMVLLTGCSFIEGVKLASTPEYQKQLEELTVELEKSKETASAAMALYEKAKEESVSLGLLMEFKELALDAKDHYEEVKTDTENLVAHAGDAVGDKDVWSKVGFGFMSLVSVGLTILGGGKQKALVAVLKGIELLKLGPEQKKILKLEQASANVHGLIKKHIKKVRAA